MISRNGTFLCFFFLSERRQEDSDKVDDFMVSTRRAKAPVLMGSGFVRCEGFLQALRVHGVCCARPLAFGSLAVISVMKGPAT